MSERVHVTASTGLVDPENVSLYLKWKRIKHQIKGLFIHLIVAALNIFMSI